jgi:perosamine synthetase
MIEAKRRIFGWYADGLKDVPNVTLNHEMPWARSIYWMTSILVDEKSGIARDNMRTRLKQANIDTRPVFPAISQYSIWSRPQTPQPVAKRIGEQAINLPSGVRLTRAEVDYVCERIYAIMVNA